MLFSGWAANCWLHVAFFSFLLLLLTRSGLAEQEQNHTEDVEVTRAVCPYRDWVEVQAELFQQPTCAQMRWGEDPDLVSSSYQATTVTPTPATTDQPKQPSSTVFIAESATSAAGATVATSDQPNEQELDIDSALDNANFLSFEDWKKQNLAKAGQSAENVGGNRRATASVKEDQRRPTGINNALDSLGDESEIELDFRGFGADPPDTARPTAWKAKNSSSQEKGPGANDGSSKDTAAADPPSPSVEWTGTSRRHDAGTTCKERFNYASFDCAATVLKTNPECQGSSSVLIENKDSYMLSECRAQNKFLILELCDDILVDTVVLANYEFFSSIFRTFRVSVSDRYPAKPDQWKELGIYEGKNTREVQAFAVENPLIWARYLKIELLTHYGNEFYCPLSLIRVHGTTMMEEYKHDGEAGRIDDVLNVESPEPGDVAVEQEDRQDSEPAVGGKESPVSTNEKESEEFSIEGTCPNHQAEVVVARLLKGHVEIPDVCPVVKSPAPTVDLDNSTEPVPTLLPVSDNVTNITNRESRPFVQTVSTGVPKKADSIQNTTEHAMPNTTSSFATKQQVDHETVQRNATVDTESKSTMVSKEESSTTPEPTKPTATQPPTSNPTTQESFFKSVHKRLQMLESNSTLSLLYIEEQSRILRDAFSKVEKRQLAKTSTFLGSLNDTVRGELNRFREQYEAAWKSVAFEFDLQRIQYYQEVYSLSAKMNVLADELVFQKRVSVIQSIMVLICFGLVLFSRGPISSYLELPSVQNMVARSHALRSSSPFFGSTSASPISTRPASLYRRDGRSHSRNDSGDSQDVDADFPSPSSPTSTYNPRTPTPDGSSESELVEKTKWSSIDSVTGSASRSESSPPVLNRTGVHDDDDEGAPRSSQET